MCTVDFGAFSMFSAPSLAPWLLSYFSDFFSIRSPLWLYYDAALPAFLVFLHYFLQFAEGGENHAACGQRTLLQRVSAVFVVVARTLPDIVGV